MKLLYKLCLRCGRLVTGLDCPICMPHSANRQSLKRNWPITWERVRSQRRRGFSDGA